MTHISEIEIIPIKPQNGLLAFANFVLDEKFFLSSIAVHSRLDGNGYRLTYPTKNVGNKPLNLFHPINREVSKEVEKAVIQKFKEVMQIENDRHNCTDYPTG